MSQLLRRTKTTQQEKISMLFSVFNSKNQLLLNIPFFLAASSIDIKPVQLSCTPAIELQRDFTT